MTTVDVSEVAESSALVIGTELEALGTVIGPLDVRLSRELITLLSEQLYTSPSKAVEELVVNAFDADAPGCWVFVPSAAQEPHLSELGAIAVFDNGTGMDTAGLTDLWRVGASSKRSEQVERIRKRTQIGKFGIGKLATYALASQITYVTSTGDGVILSVTLAFEEFKSAPSGDPEAPVSLKIAEVTQDQLLSLGTLVEILRASGAEPSEVLDPSKSWTLVLLERLKDKAKKLTPGRLRWVLSTAMPLSSFTVTLNGDPITSSKQDEAPIAELSVGDLPQGRLDRLGTATGVTWSKIDRVLDDGTTVSALASELLPAGIFGTAIVMRKTIYGGKSRDLVRSHGFFVRVRGRLIAEDDVLFGNPPLSFEVFNRFRADIDADDLDEDITAPREGTVSTERVVAVREVLRQVFYEMQGLYNQYEKVQFKQETKREEERNYVYPRYMERPLADALLRSDFVEPGATGVEADADESWFYLEQPEDQQAADLAATLYQTTSRAPYAYRLEDNGREGRLVEFRAASREFVVNSEHELALAFKDNRVALDLLYDLATAEMLLEVYLRELGLKPSLIGELLERRDGLFRSLAREQRNSPASIAAALRDSVSSERDLEIALVVAARALGFVAKHIGNAGRADGVARFRNYDSGVTKLTLEAKSSANTPSLGSIDFAGLREHMDAEGASGCLLLAPAYPGGSKGDDAAAAQRAIANRVSCWTVEQLASVVESLGQRDITARAVLVIVEKSFTPDDVAKAVAELLADPTLASREIAAQVLAALRVLEDRNSDSVRSRDMIIGTGLVKATTVDLEKALVQLAGASAGAMTPLGDGRFHLNTSIEELERRVAGWANNDSSSRRGSTFRRADEHRSLPPETGDT